MGRDGEGDKKEVKGWKGRGKDLPDQCQTASYAPVRDASCGNLALFCFHRASMSLVRGVSGSARSNVAVICQSITLDALSVVRMQQIIHTISR